MTSFRREDVHKLKEVAQSITTINWDLFDFTIMLMDELKDEFKGNPWILFRWEKELAPMLKGLPNIHRMLQNLPLVEIKLVEKDGLVCPQIEMDFKSLKVPYVPEDNWNELNDKIKELENMLSFYIK